jgi:hypothetical protein
MKVYLVVALLALSVASCAPYSPSEQDATSDLSNMRFVRHANGLCFGVIRFATYGGMEGVSITNVPATACNAVAK